MSVPIQMPSAPPYAPVQQLPWTDEIPPPPPSGPLRSGPRPPRGGRARAAAIVVAMSLLCAGIGLEIGSAVFGRTEQTASTTAAKADSTPLPTVGTTPSNGSSSSSLTTADIAAAVDLAVVDINTTLDGGHAAGTGMVLTSGGLVLTNNHVIADATDIRVQINGAGDTYSATVLGYDISDDVALLQIDGVSNLATINVGDSSTVAVRDRVIALGNALGKGGTPAVAEGSVTDLHQTIRAGDPGAPAQTLTDLIEISAPLVPGDSGGPLVNASGQVVGMNAAASQSAQGRPANDAYAIPINKALDIAHQIQAGQSSAKVHIGARALLGVQVRDAQGAEIAAVQSGSPAEAAGMAAGDVIVVVGDTTIRSLADLPTALDRYHPGDKVSIGWIDGRGARQTATVQLIEGPPA